MSSKILKKCSCVVLVLALILGMSSLGYSKYAFTKGTMYFYSDIHKAKLISEYDRNTTVDEIDTVLFGSYPQKDINGIEREPIEWIVLDRQGNRALLLSKYILDCKCYENEYKKTDWENCSLRKWLNELFYNYTFNIYEQNCIHSVNLINADNAEFKVDGGNNTTDKVFCLSIDEVKKYFGQSSLDTDHPKLATRGTEYAKVVDENFNLWVNSRQEWYNGNSSFWLRSPGKNNHTAADVYSYGHIDIDGHVVDNHYFGVRPAIWVTY